jgi:hypothetical protein
VCGLPGGVLERFVHRAGLLVTLGTIAGDMLSPSGAVTVDACRNSACNTLEAAAPTAATR